MDISAMLLNPPLTHSQALLDNGSVHIWKIESEKLADREDYFYSILSSDENSRARKFHFDKERLRFIVARGGLRLLCAHYLGAGAKEIAFGHNYYGKPFVLNHKTHTASNIQFNVSHSGEYIVIALSQGVPVGIDIEQITNDIEFLEIAQNFFSPVEYAELIKQPVIEQCKAFFHIWTRKEAYIKAKGKGLSIPLDSFDVSIKTLDQSVSLNVGDAKNSENSWSIYDLTLTQGYAAALAIESGASRLSYFDLSEFL